MLTDQGLPVPERYWAVAVIALGLTLAVLDSAIANVALPTIARDTQASAAASIWVVNAYQLSITISLLPLASLGDRIGYRRIYTGGLALFTLASLGCALSGSLPMLAAMRVVQGFGAAGLMSVNTALVRTIYPPTHLGRGVALNAMVVAIASAVGPTVASGVLAVASWPWLFAINVPIGIVTIVGAFKALPNNPGHNAPYDYLSAVMNAFVFGLMVFTIDGAGHSESSQFVLLQAVAVIAVGYFFVKRQLRQKAPLLPVDLLRIPVFETTFGFTQVETGLLITPWPFAIVFAAPISGVLSDRYSAGLLGGIGLVILATGLVLLATLGAHPAGADIAWRMAVCGVGFGLFQAPNNRQLLSAAPRERSGGASGMLGTARLTGQTLGAALVALIFGVAPVSGPTICLQVAAGFAALAACVSLLRMRQPERAAA